jgi:hypothetical protein
VLDDRETDLRRSSAKKSLAKRLRSGHERARRMGRRVEALDRVSGDQRKLNLMNAKYCPSV